MKLLRLLIVSLVCIAFGQYAFSQAWLNGIEDNKKAGSQNISFYDIRTAFNGYWIGKKIEKGKGWKQFRRWENFMEPRVFPGGDLKLPDLWDASLQNPEEFSANSSNWIPEGPFTIPGKSQGFTKSGMGRINCIAFHPLNQEIIYVGSPSGGLWKTINGGQSWITTTDKLLSIGVSDIAIDPVTPNTIYIATGDGDAGDTYGVGILKSNDAGASWMTTNLSTAQSTGVYNRRIIINPTNPNILLVTSNIGIYRTEDGFTSYSLVKTGNFKDIEFKPGNPLIVYATNFDADGNAGVYKSTDGGKTFGVATTGIASTGKVNRIELAVSPANSDYVYALCSSSDDDSFYALFKSTDSGDKWTKIYDNSKKNLLGYSTSGSDGGGQGWYDLALLVLPTSVNDIYVGGVNIYKSDNGGSAFTINAHWVGTANIDYVHADQHMLSVNPLNNYIYSCNDGGVYVSKDNGETWTDISNGLSILQIYRISASHISPDFFLTGNQDNGSFRMLDGTWTEINAGDGMECRIDPSNDNIVYSSLYYGSFYRSDDKGETFNFISPQNSGEGAWITPFALSESNPSHIFTGYSDIYKSYNRGDNWFKISHGLSGTSLLRSIAVSSLDENYIYASTYDSLWMTRNGGRSWEDISPGNSLKAITSITVSPIDPLKVWLTFSGYQAGEKVYYSDNGGKNWTNYSEGLPNLPVNTMIYQKGSNQVLYAGTDLGVFFRDKTMSAWEPYNSGLPNVIINDFDIQYKQERLIAGSYGRGLWTSPLADAGKKSLFAEILVPARYICTGDPIVFNANTSEIFDSIVWIFPDGMESQTKFVNTPVSVSFSSAGIKKIRISIFNGGNVYSTESDGYIEVISSPDIDIISFDTFNFHTGSTALLSVFGASEYKWDYSPFLNILTSDLVAVNPARSTTYYVSGSAGSCSSRDSFSLYVRPGPENDDICSAMLLQTGKNGPFTNFFASVQKNEPLPDTSDCNTQMSWCEQEGGLQTSVWFKYTANSNIASVSTAGFDTQIALYNASSCEDILGGNYNILAANDDYYGSDEYYAAAIEKVKVIPGKTYFLQVDGSAGGMTGRFYITVLDTQLGIENDPVLTRKILIFPNPSVGEVSIKITNAPSLINLQLCNSQGRLIQSNSYKNLSSSLFEKRIKLPYNGVFLVKISGEGIDFTEKVVNAR